MRFVPATALLFLLGCSTTESVSEPSAFPRAEDANAAEPLRTQAEVRQDERGEQRAVLERGAYLVWGRSRGGSETTYAVAADGAVLGDVPGAVVAVGGHLYRWEVRPVKVRRHACMTRLEATDGLSAEQVKASQEAWEAEQKDIAEQPTRTVDRAELVDFASGARKVVSELRLDDAEEGDLVAGATDFGFTVTLTGSVGSYLFVRESTWVDGCGAHPNAFSAAGILDLASDAKSIDVGAIPPAELKKARARAEKQFDELRKEWNGEAEDESELVELLPQYDARGSLSFLGRFATFAPYAFSQGDWGSYTLATTTRLAALPERLARTTPPPPAVRSFLQTRTDFTMGGFSAATAPSSFQ